MSGELLAFLLFVAFMLSLIGWGLRRAHTEYQRLDPDELRKLPP